MGVLRNSELLVQIPESVVMPRAEGTVFSEHLRCQGPAHLLPTGSPVSTTTFLTGLFPEPQTAGHRCCEPGTLSLASPLPFFSHFSVLSRRSHFPPLACPSSCVTEDLRRRHRHHCLLTSDSVPGTDLQLCVLLGSLPGAGPPSHLQPILPRLEVE